MTIVYKVIFIHTHPVHSKFAMWLAFGYLVQTQRVVGGGQT